MSDFSEAVTILGPFSSTGLSWTFPAMAPWAAAVQGWAPAPFRAPGGQRVKLPVSENRGGQSWELVGSSKEEKKEIWTNGREQGS